MIGRLFDSKVGSDEVSENQVDVVVRPSPSTITLHSRLRGSKSATKKYEQTELLNSTNDIVQDQASNLGSPSGMPALPATGLPAGWTMEQWEYYGQDYLDGKLG